jgi:hypothetical protein
MKISRNIFTNLCSYYLDLCTNLDFFKAITFIHKWYQSAQDW